MPFLCSICGEESTRICARCTKDSCNNHLCEKCLRCSDCCECEVTLSDHAAAPVSARSVFPKPEPTATNLEDAAPEPLPEPPHPAPDPDPFPEPDGPDAPAVA
jgi:hypothetical protein